MDINEFVNLLQEYTLDNENYKQWRKIHGKAFGKVFLSALEESSEAQIHLTAALIKISKRDFDGGLAILLMLENLCFNDFDCFSIFYFIGLCYEFLENEKKMNQYYEKMREYDEIYSFKIAFHPYYRTAKFAQRKSENKKALNYYNKALELYPENETDKVKLENMAQIYYDMATIYLSCQEYEKSWKFVEKSCKCSPAENPQRNYIMAILYAIEGKREEAKKIVNGLPDYLKEPCKQIISTINNKQGKKMKSVLVKEIFCKDGFFYVKLDNNENYEMIYRAAKGVYWDSETSSLFYKGKVTQEDAIKHIFEAMENEYRLTLIFD